MSGHPRADTRIGVPSSQATVKPFVFSKVELTDDDNFLAIPSGIGEIKIVISEISIKKYTKAASYKAAVPQLPQEVHERSKKGLFMVLGFSNARINYENTSSRLGHLCFQVQTIVLLTVLNPKHISLMFAPSDVLQANGIAPLHSTGKSLVMPKVEDQEEEREMSAETKRTLQAALRRIEILESSQKRNRNARTNLSLHREWLRKHDRIQTRR
ncbi:hypothetical protein K443DRAFT_9419 [Laccaria amethystina LaAM-08-1]|uniref:Uncharacterized protein n=1 Tax=Laccaria amethystina LaAM-08-1 TaxID=1095629 RepID=A0A0C9XQ73_9AGAR|nr:hypothetical protein K443DRAFT_9419 [Laccaria amethystina LaAM-08-1]